MLSLSSVCLDAWGGGSGGDEGDQMAPRVLSHCDSAILIVAGVKGNIHLHPRLPLRMCVMSAGLPISMSLRSAAWSRREVEEDMSVEAFEVGEDIEENAEVQQQQNYKPQK